MVEDLAFEKKGTESVGVASQPYGELGRANCQLGVSLWVANDRVSVPIAFDLYLPEAWAKNPERRAKAGIPDEVGYRTKAEVALNQIRAAAAAGMLTRFVLARNDYGSDASFCAGLRARGLDYTVEIGERTTVWVDKLWSERATSIRVLRRRGDEVLVSVEDPAKALPEGRWHQARWSDSLGSEFGSRLAGFSVRRRGPATAAHKFADEWLFVERRPGNGPETPSQRRRHARKFDEVDPATPAFRDAGRALRFSASRYPSSKLRRRKMRGVGGGD